MKDVLENARFDTTSRLPTSHCHHEQATATSRIPDSQNSESKANDRRVLSYLTPSIDKDTSMGSPRARAGHSVLLDWKCPPYAYSLAPRSLESGSANFIEALSVVLNPRSRNLQNPDIDSTQPLAFRELSREALSAPSQSQASAEDEPVNNSQESDTKQRNHDGLNYHSVSISALGPPMVASTGMKPSPRYLSGSTKGNPKYVSQGNFRIFPSPSLSMSKMMKTSRSLQSEISRHFIVRHRARLRAPWQTAIGKIHG